MSVMTMTLPLHIPVLLDETIEALQVQPGKRYVDCTLGSGGHALEILTRSSPGGRLLGIDADPESIWIARGRLADHAGSAILVNDNFSNLGHICRENGFFPVGGILFDLGMSSVQLVSPHRGFSFQQEGPLDMRFGLNQEVTAADIVNSLSEEELAQLIWDYGEDRYSRQIARLVVRNRPIYDTLRLAQIVQKAVGSRRGKIHQATRTFLALRIAVNHEMENLERSLGQTIDCLESGGRLAVISYHSLEDRIVKRFMQREARGCLCLPEAPVCRCGHTPSLRTISKQVITPSLSEVQANPRSRSAKLRVAERL